ncbi:MAG TPA: hypothetical protein VNP96_07060 [Solirubrobacterales bacterium]|nr:hypothetical protein [Solirubrobacterales bacterium]
MADGPKNQVGLDLSARRRLVGLYGRIWRTYIAWARSLLPLAVIVFVPLGLVHAIPVHVEATSIDFDTGLKAFGAMLALLLLTMTGLLGEIFYTGAVAIALTHPHGGEPPPLREIARTIDYRTLIAVDLIFGVLVALGLITLVVPGLLAFVYLGLAAPVVEIEHRGVRGALARSVRLVRGRFWFVLLALLPIEIASDAIGSVATHLIYGLFGDSLIAGWFTDTASNIVLTPFYAVAAVLLTLDLIAEKDGATPRLHSTPAGS